MLSSMLLSTELCDRPCYDLLSSIYLMLSSYFRLETGFEPGTFGVAFNASVLRPNANWDKIVVLVFTIIYIFLRTFYETQNLVFLQNINITVFFLS